MNLLCDPLVTRPFMTGWEISIKPCPNWRFGCIDNLDLRLSNYLILTPTQTWSDLPEPLLTLPSTECVVGYVEAIVGVSEYLSVGLVVGFLVGSHIIPSEISTLTGELSLFPIFTFLIVNDGSVVMETIKYMPLISFPVRLKEDGELMEHCPSRNLVLCTAKFTQLICRWDIQEVWVWKGSTSEPCITWIQQ